MDKLMIVVLFQAISLVCLNNEDLYNEETDRTEVGWSNQPPVGEKNRPAVGRGIREGSGCKDEYNI